MTLESAANPSPIAAGSAILYAILTPATLVTLMLGLKFNQPFFKISEYLNWILPVIQVVLAVALYKIFRASVPPAGTMNTVALFVAIASSLAEFVRVTLVYVLGVVENFGQTNELLRVGGGSMWLWFLLVGLLARRSGELPRKWSIMSYCVAFGWAVAAWGTLFQQLDLIKIVMGIVGVPMGLILVPLWSVWLSRRLRAGHRS